MSPWRSLLPPLLLTLLPSSRAVDMRITQDEANRQICSGMYSRKSWAGAVDPFIRVNFLHPDPLSLPADSDPIVSLVVFEWRDKHLVGAPLPPPEDERAYICDPPSVEAGYCDDSQLGAFITAPNATATELSHILSTAVHLKAPPEITYPIKRTGYYCVGTFFYQPPPSDRATYTASVTFRNAFGALPAAQIAKLPFYAALTITYAFLACAWSALYYLHRRDILPVQHYISAILFFLVLEIFVTWLFHDYQNRHGLHAAAKALLVLVSILSAARNSFSFFLLLIVCMGYGVVRPSLGKTMIYVRWLAASHFAFGLLYSFASLSVTPESAGPLLLLVVLPLAGTLTAFYIWTLNALSHTLRDLVQRKQSVKAAMYRKLWYCILLSIVVIFVFFFVNSWTFAGARQEDFVPTHWQTRWFILDGWLNLVYLADVAFVSWVWRPTGNNRRFAMSDEIAQDDDGFEIASLRSSLDFDADADADDDFNAAAASPNPNSAGDDEGKPPAYDAPPRPPRRRAGSATGRDVSPLPAPTPVKPTAPALPRASLDGETIFALGEGDEEDEESDAGDGKREGSIGGKRS